MPRFELDAVDEPDNYVQGRVVVEEGFPGGFVQIYLDSPDGLQFTCQSPSRWRQIIAAIEASIAEGRGE